MTMPAKVVLPDSRHNLTAPLSAAAECATFRSELSATLSLQFSLAAMEASKIQKLTEI
jgi:hypothetical protein